MAGYGRPTNVMTTARALPPTLAERFNAALEACDQAYTRADATPVVAQAMMTLPVTSPAPPLHAPASSAFPGAPPPHGGVQAPAVAPPACAALAVAPPPGALPPPVSEAGPGQKSSILRTLAIFAGVIILGIGAWFIRQKLIVPMLYGRRGGGNEARVKSLGAAEEGNDGEAGEDAYPWGGPTVRPRSILKQAPARKPQATRRVRLVDPLPSTQRASAEGFPAALARASAAAAPSSVRRLQEQPEGRVPSAVEETPSAAFFSGGEDAEDPNFTEI